MHMKNLFKKSILGISVFAVALVVAGFVSTRAATLPIAGQTYTLAGAGVSSNASSITLQSFTIKQTGQKIQDSDMSDTFYATIEPGNNAKQEIVGCTTVVQNGNGTATLANCARGLSPIYPYTASSTLAFVHAGGSQVIFSDPPQLFNRYPAKDNVETITQNWSAPDPVGATDIANKEYVLSVVNGGAVSTDRVIVAGTAGETVVAGNVLYLKQADARWYKASVAIAEASSTILGIAQGSGTAGNAIATGVLMHGVDNNQSTLTAGMNYFLGTTAGLISTATSTRSVGRAKTTSSLYFDTYSIDTQHALTSVSNVFSATNQFTATTSFSNIATSSALVATTTVGNPPVNILDIGKNVQLFTSGGTFNVKPGVKIYHVRVLGGGGGGGSGSGSGGVGAGGAGGFNEGWFDLSATTTLNVVVGASGGSGSNGGTSSFGAFASSTGGGSGGGGSGGAGGTSFATTSVATIFAINGAGQSGSPGSTATGFAYGGQGGSSPFGGGGAWTTGNSASNATGYGAGGSGNGNSGSGGNGTQGFVLVEW